MAEPPLPDEVTVLIEFSLAEPTAETLAAKVAEVVAETIARRQGFISATFLASTDGHRMVNLARWASEESWRSHASSPERPANPTKVVDDPDLLRRIGNDEPAAQVLHEWGVTLDRVAVLRAIQTVTHHP